MCSPYDRLKKSHVWYNIPEAHWCTNPVPLFGCHVVSRHVKSCHGGDRGAKRGGEGGREEGKEEGGREGGREPDKVGTGDRDRGREGGRGRVG